MLKRFGLKDFSGEEMSESSPEKGSKLRQPLNDSEDVHSASDLPKAEKKKGAEEPLYLIRYE
jgi:hypothetical protein